jgi:hypothetical protein
MPARATPTARRGQRTAKRTTTATQDRDDPVAIDTPVVDIELEDLSDHNESINILLYGPSGHGKTVLAGGAPNATFLSTESGVVAAQRAGSKARLMRAMDWEHCVAGIAKAEQTMGPEDWLIVDSVSKMQRLQIRGILKYQNALKSTRDLDIPGLADHQKWQNQFMRFLDKIYDAPFNSIIIAQSMVRNDQEGEEQVLPLLVGGDRWVDIAHYMCAQADVVLYYALTARTDPASRRLLAQPSPPYFAKDRYNALGRWQDVVDGDYTAMAEFIQMFQGTYGELDSE